METLQVGIVGFGLSGEIFHAPFLHMLPGWHIHSIVSSQKDKVKSKYKHVNVYPDLQSLLTNPLIDIVIITTPNITHFPFAKLALEAQKHVVVEKPFVITRQEGEILCDMAKKNKKILSVYHNRRWDSGFLTLQKLLQENKLGKLRQLEIHFDRFRPMVNKKNWRETKQKGAGILYDLGSHLLDQALFLFGKPDKYQSDISILRDHGEVDDYFHINLFYEDLRVILHASSTIAKPQAHLLAHGDKGSFVKYNLDIQEAQLKSGLLPTHENFGKEDDDAELTYLNDNNELVTVPQILERGNYADFYRQLHDAICLNQTPPVLPEFATEVIGLIEQMLQ